jgi:flagellin-like hook-associated protein FlgL
MNNDVIFTAVEPGTAMNGVEVVFNPVPGGPIALAYVGNTLTVDYDPGVSRAQDIIAALAADPLAATFAADLDPTDGNDGSGLVGAASATLAGGSQTLTGADVNPLETEGVFNALLRLRAALLENDITEAQRAINLLDDATVQLNFARAELGARQQGLDTMQIRLDDENVQLRSTLSEDFDADLTEVISEFTGRQIAYEAALRSAASILQMSLLDYL